MKNPMKRLLPAPLLSAALFLLWLLLNRSASPGNLVMALVLAWLVPLLTRGLRPLPVRIRRPGVVLRLGLRVMVDTLHSNAAVLRLSCSHGCGGTLLPSCISRCNCATPMRWQCWP